MEVDWQQRNEERILRQIMVTGEKHPLKLGLLSDVNLFTPKTPQMKGLYFGLSNLGYREGLDFYSGDQEFQSGQSPS